MSELGLESKCPPIIVFTFFPILSRAEFKMMLTLRVLQKRPPGL